MSMRAALNHNHGMEDDIKYLKKQIKRLNGEMLIVKQNIKVVRAAFSGKLKIPSFDEFKEEGK